MLLLTIKFYIFQSKDKSLSMCIDYENGCKYETMELKTYIFFKLSPLKSFDSDFRWQFLTFSILAYYFFIEHSCAN